MYCIHRTQAQGPLVPWINYNKHHYEYSYRSPWYWSVYTVKLDPGQWALSGLQVCFAVNIEYWSACPGIWDICICVYSFVVQGTVLLHAAFFLLSTFVRTLVTCCHITECMNQQRYESVGSGKGWMSLLHSPFCRNMTLRYASHSRRGYGLLQHQHDAPWASDTYVTIWRWWNLNELSNFQVSHLYH